MQPRAYQQGHQRGLGVGQTHLPHALLSLYLAMACYLACFTVAVGPLTIGAWERGGHVTPEQVAFHDMLDRLGYPDHHHVHQDLNQANPSSNVGAYYETLARIQPTRVLGAGTTAVFKSLQDPAFFPDTLSLFLIGTTVANGLLLLIGWLLFRQTSMLRSRFLRPTLPPPRLLVA